MWRTIAGVIVGYLIFGVSAVLLFVLSGRQPASQAFMIGSIVYGMVFAFIGGWVAATLAKRRGGAALWVGIVIAVGAVISLLASPAGGAIWSQVSALVLMAPSAVLAGRTRSRISFYAYWKGKEPK
jgi:hypothetical protein